jgi:hypothetical protein
MTELCRPAAAILLLALAGCAPGRMADLKDAGRLSLGLGLGLSVDAKLGDLTHPSLGILSASAMFGSDSRKVEGLFYEARTSEPYATYWMKARGFPTTDALNTTGWRGAFEVHSVDIAIDAIADPSPDEPPEELGVEVEGREVLAGRISVGRWLPIPLKSRGRTFPLWTFNTATDFQAGATLLLVSARAGVNVLETFDFLLGFAGLDIAGDDEKE